MVSWWVRSLWQSRVSNFSNALKECGMVSYRKKIYSDFNHNMWSFNLNQSTFVTKAKPHDPISCLHTLHQPQPPLPGFKFIKIYFLIKPGFSFYISLKVIIELHINLFLGHLVWSHMRCKTGPKGFDKSKDWFIHGAKRTAPKKTFLENDSLFFVTFI